MQPDTRQLLRTGSYIFGTGAIAFAVMLINGVPLLLCAAISCVMSVLMALLIGLPTLRLRGHYFVIATMLVAEGIRSLVISFRRRERRR